MPPNYSSVEAYINSFEGETKVRLRQLQTLTLTTVPTAQESIAYKMPAYKLHGKPLIYFAAYNNHIGLYALPTTHALFKKALVKYKQGKGSVQLPYTMVLPTSIIQQMLLFNQQQIILA